MGRYAIAVQSDAQASETVAIKRYESLPIPILSSAMFDKGNVIRIQVMLQFSPTIANGRSSIAKAVMNTPIATFDTFDMREVFFAQRSGSDSRALDNRITGGIESACL